VTITGDKGILISLEGIDGAGKTTLAARLREFFSARTAVVSLREPGGTRVSEQLRRFLLDNANQDILQPTEAFLYAAARAQVVEERIRPALNEGRMVLLDRYTDSTLAYQGYGRGLDIGFLRRLNALCSRGIVPELTLLLDLDPQTSRSRQTQVADRLEGQGEAFLARVREGYLCLAAREPARIKRLDAGARPEQVFEAALQAIGAVFPGYGL
jgi:dTMP kinase